MVVDLRDCVVSFALGPGHRRDDRSPGSDTYLAARYRRIAARRDPIKALVAMQHAMLVAIWNMANKGASYDDPGPDYCTRLPRRVVMGAQCERRSAVTPCSERWPGTACPRR